MELSSVHKWCSVQFSHSVVSNSLQPQGLQHTRLPCPSPTPGVYPNSFIHWASDAIQPSHSLPSPSPPAFNVSSIRVFSNESVLQVRWLKYWSFNISPSNEYSGLISSTIDLLNLQGFSIVFFNTTVQKHQFFDAQLSFWSNSHIHTWLLEKP